MTAGPESRACWGLNNGAKAQERLETHGPSRWQPLWRGCQNQVLIEMAIQELVTVSVANVNLSEPIRTAMKAQ